MPQKVSRSQHPLQLPLREISCLLIKTKRRQTVSIVIENDEKIKVFAPVSVLDHEIMKFVREKGEWIARKTDEIRKHNKILKKKKFADGHEFLFLGKKYPLRIKETRSGRKRILFHQGQWVVCLPEELSPREKEDFAREKLRQWYERQAREILGSRVFHYCRLMDLDIETLSVRGQRRIWGSCQPRKKAISLNWKMIMSPMHVIDYIIVHELSHLKVPNHSKRFWKHVEDVLPDYKDRQKWLTVNRTEMFLP